MGSFRSGPLSVGNYADGLNVYYGKGYNNRTQNTLNFDFKLEQKLDFLTKGLQAHVKGAYNSGVTITKRREGRANKYEAIYDNSGELIYKKTQDYQNLGTPKIQVNQETGIWKLLSITSVILATIMFQRWLCIINP